MSSDTIGAVRRYVFDFLVGFIWTIDLLLVIPGSFDKTVELTQQVAKAFHGVSMTDAVLAFLLITPGIVLPYVIGLLGTLLSASLFPPYAHRPAPHLIAAVKSKLERASGIEIAIDDIGPAVRAYLVRRNRTIVLVEAEDLRLRRMLMIPFVILVISGAWKTCHFAAAIAVTAVALAIFILFLRSEIYSNDPPWKKLYYAVLMSD